jgi:large subunit ribosomal protein L1
MPNPKTGTVTPTPAAAVEDVKKGMIEYRADQYGNIHVMVGKVSFDSKALKENIEYVVSTMVKAKPQTVKGKYITNISLSTTMGPGIHVDQNSFDM